MRLIDKLVEEKENFKKEKDMKTLFQKDKEKDNDKGKHRYWWLKYVVVAIVILLFIGIHNQNKKEEETKEEAKVTYAGDGETVLKTTDDIMAEADEVPSTVSVANPEEEVEEADDSVSYGRYYNEFYNFSFQVPDGFEVYESQNVIYLRNLDTHSQIAVVYINAAISEPIETYNRNSSYMLRLKALLLGEEDKTEVERSCNQWARGHLDDATVGDFTLKKGNGTAYFIANSDRVPIELMTSDYFTTFNGAGVCLTSISQSENSSTMFSYMDQVLKSWETYELEDKSLEFATYKDENSGVSFQYPKDWDVTTNSDGMVIIKAPNKQSDRYGGTIIEFMADKGNVVSEYTDYASQYETEILYPTFIQTVRSTDIEASIKELPCFYYEVTDRIFPNANSIFNSLSLSGDTIYSKRWCFESAGYDCMLNIIVPSEAEDISETIVNSVAN